MRSLWLASAAFIVSAGMACAQTTPSSPAPNGATNAPAMASPSMSPGKTAPAVRELEHRYRQAFRAALADDLNAPVALSVLWAVVKDPQLDARVKLALVAEFDRILGLGLMEAQPPALSEECMAMIAERSRARAGGDWARADEIRVRLAGRGVMVKDTRQGTEWYLTDAS